MSSEEKNVQIFLWKIKNFNFLTQKSGERFESPNFIAKILDDTSWFIRLYPRVNESFIGCYLHNSLKHHCLSGIFYDCEIQMISSEGNILRSEKYSEKFEEEPFCGCSNFLDYQYYETPNTLTVRCTLKANVKKIPLFSEIACVTNIGVDKSSFKMIVRNLNSTCSQERKFPNIQEPQGEISVLVNADDITIKIRSVKKLVMMCQITLLDIKGRKQASRKEYHFFSNPLIAWVFPSFLKRSKMYAEEEKYLKDDCFELLFEITVPTGTHSHKVTDKTCDDLSVENLSSPDAGTSSVLEDTRNEIQEDKAYNSSVEELFSSETGILVEDFKRLFKDKIHADVKLLVNNQTILAHKSILSIRSTVFMAMFDTKMVENETGSVNIPDFEVETVNSLLEYMYTGTVKKIDYELATKLMVASDKYEVLSLKEKCANFLQPLLCDENVCDVLLVADLVQHEVLKAAATNYIKNNSESIFISDEWNCVVDRNLRLATETVRKVSMLIAADRKKNENE